jgi:hypothetical protein
MNNKKRRFQTPILWVMVSALAVPLLSAHGTASLTAKSARDVVQAGVPSPETGTLGSRIPLMGPGANTLEARMRGGRPRRRPSKDRLALPKPDHPKPQ